MKNKILKLQRIISNEHGTQGVLFNQDGEFICYTLELPYNFNQVSKSCIKAETYRVGKHDGNKFKDCFILMNVEGRTYILIHAGNKIGNTYGCILVGMGLFLIKKDDGILQKNEVFLQRSEDALNILRKMEFNGIKIIDAGCCG